MTFWGITLSEEQVTTFLFLYGGNLLMAILIGFIGWLTAKVIYKIIRKVMIKARMEPLLINFTSKILYGIILAFVAIAALNRIGVETASLIAVLGAAGLAIGLALQGSLSNFAAGIMLVIFKHFRIGDVVNCNGTIGSVIDMNIFTTTLNTFTNEKVVIPNSVITSNILINISARTERRVDLAIGVGYDDDIEHVTRVLGEVIAEDDRILPDPAPYYAVDSLGDSSVVFAVRVWTQTSNWGAVRSNLQKRIKQRFDQEGISIPYPQRDMNITLSQAELTSIAETVKDDAPGTKRKITGKERKKD